MEKIFSTESNPPEINIEKTNSDFNFALKSNEFAINKNWQNDYASWEFISGACNGIGKIVYEGITNFVQNIKDIDVCSIDALESIAKELDVTEVNTIQLAYPYDLYEMMNILSVSRCANLTTGTILSNETIKDIHQQLGADVSIIPLGPGQHVTGMVSSNIIYDKTYITGFIEKSISGLLSDKCTIPIAPTANMDNNNLYQYNLSEYNDYVGFLDSIYSNPQTTWDSFSSGEIINECTHTLRNICVKTSYDRERLKKVAKNYAMIGSNQIISKIIKEYFLFNMTKNKDWRLYTTPPTAGITTPSVSADWIVQENLPSIENINAYFDVDVVEYMDTTEYLNISAATPWTSAITGWESRMVPVSWLDISGNLCTEVVINPSGFPLFGEPYPLITGGSNRFWEGSSNDESMLLSELTSGEIYKFYESIGLSGTPKYVKEYQDFLWNNFAVSGWNRNAIAPDLTGTPNDEWINAPVSSIPVTGWLIPPTNLSGAQYKYIGTSAGMVPFANIKNKLYPTVAVQPYLWNLKEIVDSAFIKILSTLLETEQEDVPSLITSGISPSGDLINSWYYKMQEYVGYQTTYEYSTNEDYDGRLDKVVDFSSPFDQDTLSTYFFNPYIYGDPTNKNYYQHFLSGYYDQISYKYEKGIPDKILEQQIMYRNNIKELSGYNLYKYQTNQSDYIFELYKNPNNIEPKHDEFETPGELWMRFKNHPLSFPMSNGDLSLSAYFQFYPRMNDMHQMIEKGTYDFGAINDIMWVLGEFINPETKLKETEVSIFKMSMSWFPVEKQYYYTTPTTIMPVQIPLGNNIRGFVGVYEYNNYIVFVTTESLSKQENNNVIKFNFYHYNKYTYKLVNPTKIMNIGDLPKMYQSEKHENVFRLTSGDKFVTIAYEYKITDPDMDLDNGICTIDINIDTLDTETIKVMKWDKIT